MRWLTLLLFLVALPPTLLWPGDATWVNDEPRLIANAWHANQDGRLAAGGLWGNFGVRYGPLPTQIYQALLLLTHEPVTLLFLRAAMCVVVSGAAFWWLAKTLDLPRWFGAAVLLAPLVVLAQRQLWDASFTMPLGALALAAFAAFLQSGSAVALTTCVASATVLPLIHPQALPTAAPMLGWLLWKHRPAMRRHWRSLAVVLIAIGILHGPWLHEVAWEVARRLGDSLHQGYPNPTPRGLAALAPLLGGHLLGGDRFMISAGAPAMSPAFFSAALLGAQLFYPLAWLGIALALRQAWQRRASMPCEVVTLVSLAGLLLQAVLGATLRIPLEPQYFFGTFALHVWFAWQGVAKLRLAQALGAAYAMSVAALAFGTSFATHAHGRASELSQPTLREQAELARALKAFSDPVTQADVLLFQRHPQALRTLRLLLPPAPDQPQQRNARLLITESDGHLALRSLREDEPFPSATTPLDITQLPRAWLPDPKTW